MKLALISGSLRAGSTNTIVIRTVSELVGDWASPLTYLDLAELPHFNPDDDVEPLHPEVARLRELIAEADAILFCTPEYAGGLPGSFKNLLDWTVGGSETTDKPVGWINISSSPTRAEGAHRSLRTVLEYTGAKVVESACVHIPVPRTAIDAEAGTVTDPVVREALSAAARVLADHATETAGR
ncbi:NAD(P)H-dependent oxidoreductase [Streptosporangium sp. NBC_01639]|uniref:NADPH-dependent FMN reductase n=1 Tax=Streptosporangium sp. NBC_01639 TaxID=2975948 RepID=UPI00386CBA2F|nr:NAD(P)H-dependent oxidoreductase [Streptosporangium sp. NBC_01639]